MWTKERDQTREAGKTQLAEEYSGNGLGVVKKILLYDCVTSFQ